MAGPGKNNTNAAGHKNPRSGKKGKSAMMSMPHEEWEMFKAACMVNEGHALTDDECVEIWRNINRLARKAFIEKNHAMTDPAYII